MQPVLLSDRLRDRKVRKLARLLVALDDVARERRALGPRRSRMSLSTTR
jgi:hypothetical protein